MDHDFHFCMIFSDLLVGQMEATLEGQDINVRIRTSKIPGSEFKCWPDSLADDYIHRPLQEEFKNICYYDMTSRYKKIIKVTDQNLLAHMNSLKVIQDLNSAIYPK